MLLSSWEHFIKSGISQDVDHKKVNKFNESSRFDESLNYKQTNYSVRYKIVKSCNPRDL